MNDSNQRKLGAVLSYVSIIVNTLIQLLYTPLLIRMLGQSEYGLYSLTASVIGYLTVLDLGFGNAIIVYTAKYRAQNKAEEEKKLHGMFFVVFCIIGLIAGLLGLFIFANVGTFFGKTMTAVELGKAKVMMLILTFNLAITFPFSIYSSIISAYEKFTYQKLIAILSTILKPLVMIPLLFMGYKSIGMTVVITIVNVAFLLCNYCYCKKKLNINIKFKGFDTILFKEIFGYSFFIFLCVIVDKINWSVDNFVLGAVSGTVAVSVYAAASHLNNLFVLLSTAVSSVLLPKMSKMVSQNASNDELTNEFIKVGRIQYYIIFLMASGLILVGKEFFVLWAGADYSDAYYIALLLIIPVCIPLIQNLGVSIRQAMNKHKMAALINTGVALLNLIISIPLAIRYGAIGAALGTSIGLIVSSLLINIYYYKVLKLDIIKFWMEIIKITVPFVIPWLIIIPFKHFIILTGLNSIIIYGGIFAIVYSVVAYFICMNKYEKSIFKKVINRIRGVIKNGANN